MKKRVVVAVILAMAACSNTGESALETASTAVGGPTAGTTTDARSDPSLDGLTLTTVAPITIPDSFDAYTDETGGIVLFRGTMPSGAGAVTVNAATTDGPTDASVSGFENTTRPATGRAVYEGGYAGFLRETGPEGQVRPITGISQLVADFDDQRILGSIVNRRIADTDGAVRAMTFLLLDPAALTDGAFAGTTVGGDLDATSRGTLTGAYTGSLSDDALFGRVEVTHTTDGIATGQEVGAIIAAP